MLTNEALKRIENFWNNNPSGKHFITASYPSKEFFNEYRALKFNKEHHVNFLIDWQSSQNKDVLEVGVGIGTDATQWARYAKSFTGIDLSDEAVKATRFHFKILNLNGHIFRGNAESLPFFNDSFDIVYSHGVLHHTPDIESALKEICRVLKRKGQLILMLYSKNSFYYWIRIQLYFRLRFLFEFLKQRSGLRVSYPWKSHIQNLLRDGWAYFSWKNWPHHCTDGPDCSCANTYTKKQIEKFVEGTGFKINKMRKAHFPFGGKYPSLERFIARYIGFYQFVWANKP